jgi:phosphopantothenoylcysteine decarboxylase/phosphopantothenate--cysteine ligase
MSLEGRRVLVTAGPTRVPIDAVRHIGNVSSGRTGLQIARAVASAGAEVALLMGAGTVPVADTPGLRLERFVTFDDLHVAMRRHVGSEAYDAVIHAAAVSDYQLAEIVGGKISSSEPELVLRLRPTPKIVDEVRGLDPHIVLVKFKLEVGLSEAELLEVARRSGTRSDADLVVANDLELVTEREHHAWILNRSGLAARVHTTEELAIQLIAQLSELLGNRPFRTLALPTLMSTSGRRMV